jgi:ketosteroid isomerase-like protein
VESDRQIVADAFAWFMTLREGKVEDGTAFYDSIAFNELWETVSPGGSYDVLRPPGQDGR